MASAGDLARMVPGFEFLQGLMKNAGGALPGINQWVAPTLDPEELDKRIQELRTVQFWLENNAKLLGTTIQALEVQRMTLATLKTMNLPLSDLREALTIKAAPPARPEPATGGAPGPVDPMQWWGALTQQFTELATKAAKDSAADTAKNLAGAVVKQSMAVAGSTLKKAAALPAKAARAAAPRKRAR
ncbi:MAG: hypothetical protein Q8K96_03565 [Rubrivivax sp.]|nr:hypothetical protein [Rubrivivax sp.]